MDFKRSKNNNFFLKDFNFKELLGDVKYDAHGRIVGIMNS